MKAGNAPLIPASLTWNSSLSGPPAGSSPLRPPGLAEEEDQKNKENRFSGRKSAEKTNPRKQEENPKNMGGGGGGKGKRKRRAHLLELSPGAAQLLHLVGEQLERKKEGRRGTPSDDRVEEGEKVVGAESDGYLPVLHPRLLQAGGSAGCGGGGGAGLCLGLGLLLPAGVEVQRRLRARGLRRGCGRRFPTGGRRRKHTEGRRLCRRFRISGGPGLRGISPSSLTE